MGKIIGSAIQKGHKYLLTLKSGKFRVYKEFQSIVIISTIA
jgi:hypothetical protein